jgi:hypothetical protein
VHWKIYFIPSLEDEQRRTQNPEFKEERKQKTKSVVVQPTSTYYLPWLLLAAELLIKEERE